MVACDGQILVLAGACAGAALRPADVGRCAAGRYRDVGLDGQLAVAACHVGILLRGELDVWFHLDGGVARGGTAVVGDGVGVGAALGWGRFRQAHALAADARCRCAVMGPADGARLGAGVAQVHAEGLALAQLKLLARGGRCNLACHGQLVVF